MLSEPGPVARPRLLRRNKRPSLVIAGAALLALGGGGLLLGLAGIIPLELEAMTWNNIRIVASVAITGCLLAAIGYGKE